MYMTPQGRNVTKIVFLSHNHYIITSQKILIQRLMIKMFMGDIIPDIIPYKPHFHIRSFHASKLNNYSYLCIEEL